MLEYEGKRVGLGLGSLEKLDEIYAWAGSETEFDDGGRDEQREGRTKRKSDEGAADG